METAQQVYDPTKPLTSDILTAIRAKYPVYNDVMDEDLVLDLQVDYPGTMRSLFPAYADMPDDDLLASFPQDLQPLPEFDPEGDSYDIRTAHRLAKEAPLTVPKPKKFEGNTVVNDGAFEAWVWHDDLLEYVKHQSTRDPNTGMILKGSGHETWAEGMQGEKEAGYDVYRNPLDGRYYSRPQAQQSRIGFEEAVEAQKERLAPKDEFHYEFPQFTQGQFEKTQLDPEERAAEGVKLHYQNLVEEVGPEQARQRWMDLGLADPWGTAMASTFMSGFIGGKPSPIAEEVLNSKVSKATRLAGTLAGFSMLGASQTGKSVTAKLLQATDKMGMRLGTKAIKGIAQGAGQSASFALKTSQDIAANAIDGEEITPVDATKMILGAAGFGAAFGVTGGVISSPWAGVSTQAAMGYVMEKVAGGSDEDAIFTALLFGGMGLIGAKNLRQAEGEFAFQRYGRVAKQRLVKELGYSEAQAEALWSKASNDMLKIAKKKDFTLGDMDAAINKMKDSHLKWAEAEVKLAKNEAQAGKVRETAELQTGKVRTEEAIRQEGEVLKQKGIDALEDAKKADRAAESEVARLISQEERAAGKKVPETGEAEGLEVSVADLRSDLVDRLNYDPGLVAKMSPIEVQRRSVQSIAPPKGKTPEPKAKPIPKKERTEDGKEKQPAKAETKAEVQAEGAEKPKATEIEKGQPKENVKPPKPPEVKVVEKSEEEAVSPRRKIGDLTMLRDDPAELMRQDTDPSNVTYQLWEGETKNHIRTYDEETGEVITINSYSDRAKAIEEYDKAIKIAKPKPPAPQEATQKPIEGEVSPKPVEKQGKEVEPKTITDAAEVQKLKNSILEGELILRSGRKTSGEMHTTEELLVIRKSVMKTKEEIGDTSPTPEVKDPKQPTPITEPKRTPQGTKFETDQVMFPVKDLKTDLESFQGRRKEVAKESVDSIISAVEKGEFNPDKFDPVKLWKDPESGDVFILAGHSRAEAFRQLSESGDTDFTDIPAIMVKAKTKAEAQDIALTSNTATPETSLDRAKTLRNMRADGKSKKEIEDYARDKLLLGRNTKAVIELSHLEPNGPVEQAFDMFGEGSDEGRDVITMGGWIGAVKEKYPELDKSHELELFNFLKDNYKSQGLKFTAKDKFQDYVSNVIDRKVTMLEPELKGPLNFKQIASKSTAELELDARIQGLKNDLKAKQAELKEKARDFQVKAEAAKEDGKDPITTEMIDKALKPVREEIIAIERELLEAEASFKNDVEALRKQGALFDLDEGATPASIIGEYEKNPLGIKGIAGPELIRLVRKLGANVRIAPYLSGTGTRGALYPGLQKIIINPDTARVEGQVDRSLAHEGGHFIDYLPDREIKGSLLGKLLVMKELRTKFISINGKSEAEVARALEERAKLMQRLNYLRNQKKKGAKEYKKQDINDAIDSYTEKLLGIEDQFLMDKELRAEMWKLSQQWRPISPSGYDDPKFMTYRKSAAEIYADFWSALLNAPDYTYAVAPKSFDTLFDNLNKKPKVAKEFNELVMALNADETALMDARLGELSKAWEDSGSLVATIRKAEKSLRRNFLDLITIKTTHRWRKINREDRALIKKGEMSPDDSIASLMDRRSVMQRTIVYSMLEPLVKTREFMVDAGIEPVDVSNYLFLSRSATQRKNVANPFNYQPETALKTLANLKEQLGAEKYKNLERVVDELQKWHTEEVIPYLAKTGWITPEMEDNLSSRVGFYDRLMTPSQEAKLRGLLEGAGVGKILESRRMTEKDAEEMGIDYEPNMNIVTVMEKNIYHPTVPQHHFANSGINAGIFGQVGTFSTPMDPFYALLEKDIAMIRAAENNETKLIVANHALANYDNAKELRPGSTKKAKLGNKILRYRDAGKLKGVELDGLIVDPLSFNNNDTNEVIIRALARFNNLFRNAVIVYRAGFITFNFTKDINRTAIAAHVKDGSWTTKIPASSFVTWAKVVKSAVQMLPHARSKAKGTPTELVRMLLAKGAVFPNYSSAILFNDGLGRLEAGTIQSVDYVLDQEGVVDIEKEHKTKLGQVMFDNAGAKAFLAMMDKIRYFGDLVESLGKLAAYNYLKNEVGPGKMFPNEDALYNFVASYAGTPNYYSGGLLKPAMNNLSIFYTVTTSGIRNDLLRLGGEKETRGKYWYTIFTSPQMLWKMLKYGSISGAFVAWADKHGDEEDKADARWGQKADLLISPYDQKNYSCQPIGQVDYDGSIHFRWEDTFDSKNYEDMEKVIYIRVPMTQAVQTVTGLMWTALVDREEGMPTLSDIMEVFDYASDSLPAASPVITALSAWATFAAGGNPTDPFYKNQIIDDDEFRLKSNRQYWDMARWTAKHLGVPEVDRVYKVFVRNDNMTDFEKVAILAPVFSRWLKVSNAGVWDLLKKSSEPHELDKLREKVLRGDFIKAHVSKYLVVAGRGANLREANRYYLEVLRPAIDEDIVNTGVSRISRAELKKTRAKYASEYYRQAGKAEWGNELSSLGSTSSKKGKEEILRMLLPSKAIPAVEKALGEKIKNGGILSMPPDDYIEFLITAKNAGYISEELFTLYAQINTVTK